MERLRLDAVVPEDPDEHYALMSDPDVWRHLPSGRHAASSRTAQGIWHSVDHWAMVGTGGCALRVGTAWWNLYYRCTPPAWGLGLAAELVDAALDAARTVEPDRPVVAYLLEHDVESRGRAERAGLTLVWRGRTRAIRIRTPSASSTPTVPCPPTCCRA